MIGEQTVTVHQIVTTTDVYGDSTTTETTSTVVGVLFEPQQGHERTDSNSPGVTTPAKFYLPTAFALDADDTIVDADGVTWQVVAGSSVWHDQTEVAVQRASAV